MGYCTQAQVESEFKDATFTTSTVVTPTDITEFIEEADAEINSIIGVRYQTPVSSGDALVLCRRMSRALVHHRVANILKVKTGEEKTVQDPARMTRKDVMELLNKIAKGEVSFAGASLVTSTSGVRSYNSENDIEPTFKRDEESW